MRFAALGLVGFEPELIVSGINHGANLGDDITYSGPSRRPSRGGARSPGDRRLAAVEEARDGLPPRAGVRFDAVASFTARLVAGLDEQPISPGTLLNVNCPAIETSELAGAR